MIHEAVSKLLLASTCLFGLVSATMPYASSTDSLERVGPLAQATPSTNVGTEDRSKKDRLSKEAEAALDVGLLEFVEKHQPELQKLLKFMKKKQPQQYEQALKELSRVKQRLTALENRDKELYAIELELWQVRSALRMQVAQILASPKEEHARLRQELHVLAEKELDLDTARLKLDQGRVEARLANVKLQLDERTKDRDATLAKSIKTWENRAFKTPTRTKKP